MNVLGVVVEYNPFHNGHEYHLRKSTELLSPGVTVAVMSGCFTQRGEPAVVDKWARAKMALAAGIDIVVELPVAWSIRSAPNFAAGSVRLLAALGCTHICFGSEAGDVSQLTEAARIITAETPGFKASLSTALKEGIPYPAARDEALRQTAEGVPAGLLANPNNILGTHYIANIIRYNLPLKPVTIRRIGSFHDLSRNVSHPSARAIRKALQEGGEPVGMPDYAYSILQQELTTRRGPIFWDSFSQALFHRLRSMEPEELSQYAEAREGLGQRLWQAAREADSLLELLKLAKTRRYPLTRIQRLLLHILLGVTDSRLSFILGDDLPPPYARVLALNTANPAATALLKEAGLPIITALGRQPLTDSRSQACLSLDLQATDCYVLSWQPYGRAGLDYLRPFLTDKR